MDAPTIRIACLFSLCSIGGGCDGPKSEETKSAASASAKNDVAAKKAEVPPPTAKLPELPPLDAAMAKQGIEAIDFATGDDDAKMAAEFLVELEKDRLGKSFTDGLEALANVAPDQRATAAAKSISENLAMLDAACEANAQETMQSLATMSPSERNEALWAACRFDKLALVSKEVGIAADPVHVLFAHMAFAKLKQHGPVDPNEKKLLQVLASAKDPPAPPEAQ